mmetsp:Transcript_20329/g.63490  ORF Transcript_20329/g.63490 Transcript_20329/m.63490 type:complete len:434 (+) Transcript_20329:88-1389(+)
MLSRVCLEQRIEQPVAENILRVKLPARRVELVHRETVAQPAPHGRALGGVRWRLDFGPMLVRVVLGPQLAAADRVVVPEGVGDCLPRLRPVDREVHDDAHPRVEVVLARRVGGAHRRRRAARPALLDRRRRWDVRSLDEGEQVGHVLQVAPVRGADRAARQRHLGHPLLPSALKAENPVGPVDTRPLRALPKGSLGAVHIRDVRLVERRELEQCVAQLRKVHPRRAGLLLRRALQQQLAQRLGRPRLVDGRGWRAAAVALPERVAGDDDDRVRVRDPHVPHVLVLEQLCMPRRDPRASLDADALHELVRRHALQSHLGDDAERAEPHPGQAEEARVVCLGEADLAQRGRDQSHAHHLLVHRRDRGARAVCSDLDKAADLLLGDGGVVLQRQAVRAERLHHLADARARLHRHLPPLGVDREDLGALGHVDHRTV